MQPRNFLSATPMPNPRMFAIRDARFREAGKTTPAWEYQQFLDLALKGVPPAGAQREDPEVSIPYRKKLLSI